MGQRKGVSGDPGKDDTSEQRKAMSGLSGLDKLHASLPSEVRDVLNQLAERDKANETDESRKQVAQWDAFNAQHTHNIKEWRKRHPGHGSYEPLFALHYRDGDDDSRAGPGIVDGDDDPVLKYDKPEPPYRRPSPLPNPVSEPSALEAACPPSPATSLASTHTRASEDDGERDIGNEEQDMKIDQPAEEVVELGKAGMDLDLEFDEAKETI